MTENHDYNTPQQGTTDWNVPLNENFERLDGDVEIRDRRANMSDYRPKPGAKFLAIDSEATFIGDGDQWNRLASSGRNPAFESVNNEAYASQYPGGDLGAKVTNAIADAGNGTVRITPRNDGEPWQWSTDVVHNVDNSDNPLEIVAGSNVPIEYTGDGFMLTVRDAWGSFDLRGGKWTATGEAKGWLRMIDNVRSTVRPNYVDFRTSNELDHSNDGNAPRDVQGAVAISMENHEVWSELNTIEGDFKADNGIDFRPVEYTSGSDGTDSFQSTTIRDTLFHTHANGGFGFRLRGNHQYCSYRGLRFHINAENGNGLLIDTGGIDTLKVGFRDLKFENNNDASGETAIRATSAYDAYYPVVFDNIHISGSVENDYIHEDGDARVINRSAGAGRWVIGGLSDDAHELRFKSDNGLLEIKRPDGSTNRLN